ncbi:bifunctional diaminohydroxyphosphoribosylaminopyrimidine deaminase/5-amino-6-(5-phosphoribosylamino)uracil reductase RibD [Glaciecola sp. MH2013]|uniref:bifunctional diaminohydroxyphosphoribosylaminopyrimidine deaminase/5-amino-6-(5-phosphoribosylamino)uracil reductase RibD n=1 Tax=Glaciecola sp. MH2013 TaxID=2785524 RepID=UPI00189E82E0|nr:bifunctional diaminohydroxyphosphoribosylaminopyrimidine deaminase/5-amino-6-(5-phosphoribosylamino)uracil reductase RibD [Glaciecola sp. MH2013]MBF7074712.1 bifunctional diaminohydroxyphosphoribosylaminopyrimidine deaminase/5-amino-6-(5-phosphoribosylamino)uracil reductase RibD [Glaciecola sp. MH2013]
MQDKDKSFSSDDAKWMALAIEEAKKGCCSTTPNPAVGCVIVNAKNELLGKGYHIKAGSAHAEVNALKAAGFSPHQGDTPPLSLTGATAYVTLEPCSHTGRTPPCAKALIEAKIARVVIASVDLNPLVHNQGIALLEKAGISVQSGLMEKEAQSINRAFNYRIVHDRPFVSVKLAASIDAKTALLNGESKWITGEPARADVQIERANSCAILSGADTVISDNPRLNVRPDTLPSAQRNAFKARQKQPLRVIIDGKNRLNNNYQIFQDGQPVLVFNAQHNNGLTGPECEQVQVPKKGDYLCLDAIMQHLAMRQINRVWTEAGAKLCGALFHEAWVNELIVYQAPMLLGNKARALVEFPEITSLAQAQRLCFTEITQLGNDLKLRITVKS